jgi:predicted small secreted protein
LAPRFNLSLVLTSPPFRCIFHPIHFYRRSENAVYKSLGILLAVLVLLNAAACNTIAGIGKDMQQAGETIEKKAKK